MQESIRNRLFLSGPTLPQLAVVMDRLSESVVCFTGFLLLTGTLTHTLALSSSSSSFPYHEVLSLFVSSGLRDVKRSFSFLSFCILVCWTAMSRLFLERCPRRTMVLHVDINKTIIQVDAAGGRTMEDVLNSNAAANVFGVVDDSGAWQPVFGPHDPRPSSDDRRRFISYDDYVDSVYCEPPGMQDLPKAERDAVWKKVSAARRAASRQFTFTGAVGQHYAYLVEEQRKCLTYDHGSRYHSIIPSFFYMVNTLSELNWPFYLIFRTFGSDLPHVLAEWRQFVLGEHVCKPSGPLLHEMRAHYVEPRTGCIYRDHDSLFVCYGPSVAASSSSLPEKEGVDQATVVEALKKTPGCEEVRHTDFQQLEKDLLEYFSHSNNTGGLVDYYPCWAQGAERRSGGKVYPVPMSGAKAASQYTVFFDDNIFIGEERSIVDLRDSETGESVCDEAKEKRYCVHANSYEAIVKPSYFLDSLCECLRLQQSAS